MRITRQGANRYTGKTVLVREKGEKTFGKPGQQSVAFDQRSKQIKMEVKRVENFDKSGEYDFTVSLTLSDIAEIIKQLADYGLAEVPEDINLALREVKTSMLKLFMCAEGYKTSSILPTRADAN